MESFYHLVNITTEMLPEKDYDFILLAYDDVNGNGIETENITGKRLQDFLGNGKTVHFEKMFLTDVTPKRVVYWGHSSTRGWAERYEQQL